MTTVRDQYTVTATPSASPAATCPAAPHGAAAARQTGPVTARAGPRLFRDPVRRIAGRAGTESGSSIMRLSAGRESGRRPGRSAGLGRQAIWRQPMTLIMAAAGRPKLLVDTRRRATHGDRQPGAHCTLLQSPGNGPAAGVTGRREFYISRQLVPYLIARRAQ